MFLVCGEAVIDLFQDEAAGRMVFAGQPAGSPFNVCVGLARLGERAALITGLSNDAFGAHLIAALEREGVEWRLAPRTERPTILAFVMVGPDGSPSYAFYGERGADTDVHAHAIPDPLPAAIKAIHVGGFPMAVEPAKSAYAALVRREAGRRFVSLDPNIRTSLFGDMGRFRTHFEGLCPTADLIKASSEDIRFMYPDAEFSDIAARWRGLGAAAVVVTDGARGAFALTEAGAAFAAADPVEVVDAVGAGDSFMSALLAELAARRLLDRAAITRATKADIEPVLAFANRAAGVTCTRRGSDPPTRAQIAAP